ncbi:MAG: noncanonical pyrimidine nucleotidase, YjjG family [Bacteroidales bacterium]|nr:noncanonical pyrimidine nucleotidase, YjjG family [Bacteroidales bacterium]
MAHKKYTHVFFDLDHTLWDFDTNNRLTFDEILATHRQMYSTIPAIDAFMKVYVNHNKSLWDQYKKGLIEKDFLSYHRFNLTLGDFGITNPELAKQIAADYIRISPTKTTLMDGALELLNELKQKYKLGLITNGFDEIQFVKIRHAALEQYFPLVVTSEEAGCKKPNPEIFHYALKKAGAEASSSIYIGDEPETDVKGAKEAGIDQVLVTFGKHFDESGATHTIDSLYELRNIL